MRRYFCRNTRGHANRARLVNSLPLAATRCRRYSAAIVLTTWSRWKNCCKSRYTRVLERTINQRGNGTSAVVLKRLQTLMMGTATQVEHTTTHHEEKCITISCATQKRVSLSASRFCFRRKTQRFYTRSLMFHFLASFLRHIRCVCVWE